MSSLENWLDWTAATDARRLAELTAEDSPSTVTEWEAELRDQLGFAVASHGAGEAIISAAIDRIDRFPIEIGRLRYDGPVLALDNVSPNLSTLHVAVIVSGRAQLVRFRKEKMIEAGELCAFMSYLDQTQIILDGPAELLVLSLPYMWVDGRDEGKGVLDWGVPVKKTGKVGAILRTAIVGMVAERPSADGHYVFPPIVRDILCQAFRESSAGEVDITAYEGRMRRLFRCLAKRAADPALTPADAAADLRCSVSMLHKTCARYNITFGRLLLHMRLSRAKVVLGNSDLSIAEVAYLCGFNEHSHFSKCFKEMFGLSPKDYRLGLH
ncbi:helix-turn-helix transcriptional regulator [Sphingopyxis sp.]|uniref:helix-turn-helix transcriptional regulator n=1 Tax=Sphingopyxis sp. TaxID=1908224 RepID=UPI00261DB1A4|nr:helix-turn-helix transcriptional regulator [Sphingopyxis sp.]MCW0199445.1 helix-turn-helix transcriptional regulator [Sphingopyxis sp.]